MIKYPKIPRWGHEDVECLKLNPQDEIIIEEKVDGGNGSFYTNEETGTLHFCSRNRDLTNEKDEKTFIAYREWLTEQLMKSVDDNGESVNDAYVYYVEWMAPHTIKYENAPKAIGFDIRVMKGMDGKPGLFLTREAKEKEFARLGIPVVKLVDKMQMSKIMKANTEDLIPKSGYYDGKAEGIVMKNYTRKGPDGHQIFAKVVCDMFKEQNKATFGGAKKLNTETDKLIEEFFTDARIKKMLHKLLHEEKLKLDRTLMKVLPTSVIKDVLQEEFLGIYQKYKYIDFKSVKRRVPRLCLRMIDEEMNLRMKNG